ncbi:Coumaroyl-CoA:anthocyanidin 3-O-glucoside-6''-O-coumaroyltransferase 1 [Spatholobus suberectus]|nr:Coumaroyl-CoA:anthocyanidin 3-O-glucoside-6''-O-coumaroyltransferase 1 [Spatholobus suberectus]
MKFWSYVCRTKCDVASSLEGSQTLLPLLNRDIIEDPKGLKLIFSEELWNSPTESIVKEPLDVVDSNDKVRHVFVLSRDHVEKLKKWVSVQCKGYGLLDLESLHISTFVVTCSLMWVCKVQSEEANASTINPNNGEIYKLVFLGDCRNRLEFSIPSTYFGNCVVVRIVSLERSKLMGDNGIVEAVIDIGRKVRDFQFDAMKEVESFMSIAREAPQRKHEVTIAGSPKLGAYEADFGWGKPKKCEILHIEYSGTISLSDCRDDEGGVEVGLVLGRVQMSKFSTILGEYLKNIASRD